MSGPGSTTRRRALSLAGGALGLASPLLRPRPSLALVAGAPGAQPEAEGEVEVVARQVRQGSSVFVRVRAPGVQAVTATVEGQTVPLVPAASSDGAPSGGSFVGLLGTQRYAPPGPRRLQLTLTGAAGQQTVRDDPRDAFQIVDAHYPVYRIQMPASSTALLDPAKVQAENRFLGALYGQWHAERSWRVPFVPPVGAARITAGFGDRWSINNGPANSWHEGTDYGVFSGHPIRAASAGRVLFAGPLHVRGNVVVVDHGWGVMTGYFHLSELQAQEGQAVEAGQEIGLSGATGFVNGAHLHFEVRLHNVHVEPLEWLGDPAFPRPELAAL